MSHGEIDVSSQTPSADVDEVTNDVEAGQPTTKQSITKAPVGQATGQKAPVKKAPAKKAPTKKAPAKTATAKTTSATKTPAATKKPAATKTTPKKTTATTPAVTEAPAAQAQAPKAPAKKSPAQKASAKNATAKKPAAKKTTVEAAPAPSGDDVKKPSVRLATAAQNAPVEAQLVSVPAIDHAPDLSLGGVDAPVTLPKLSDSVRSESVSAPTQVNAEAAPATRQRSAVPGGEPIAAPVEELAGQPVAEPLAQPLDEPVVQPVDEPVIHAGEESRVHLVEEPIGQPVEAHVAEPVAVPTGSDPQPRQPQHTALAVVGLTKSFGGQRVVDSIDLTVPAGSFYGIVGPNGAGKTTTLSMIAGLLKADAGTITINGTDARRDPRSARRLIGVLPDRLRTFDRLTGKQLLSYFGALRGLPGRIVDQRVADLARAFDLSEALGRVVSDYSAGMTKKIMMAGALIHSPRVLILDEPFESVDPVSATVILDILTAYVNNGGTVILSSHGMDLVERVCSRLAVIVAGQVLAEGTIEDVRGGVTLEQRFVELSGGVNDAEGLEWLHTYSA